MTMAAAAALAVVLPTNNKAGGGFLDDAELVFYTVLQGKMPALARHDSSHKSCGDELSIRKIVIICDFLFLEPIDTPFYD
jgi:hypothetical protein